MSKSKRFIHIKILLVFRVQEGRVRCRNVCKIKCRSSIKEREGESKESGRELFMTDTIFIQSNVKFFAEAGDVAITVDESLL